MRLFKYFPALLAALLAVSCATAPVIKTAMEKADSAKIRKKFAELRIVFGYLSRSDFDMEMKKQKRIVQNDNSLKPAQKESILSGLAAKKYEPGRWWGVIIVHGHDSQKGDFFIHFSDKNGNGLIKDVLGYTTSLGAFKVEGREVPFFQETNIIETIVPVTRSFIPAGARPCFFEVKVLKDSRFLYTVEPR